MKKPANMQLVAGISAMLLANIVCADPTDYIEVPIAKIQKPGHYNLSLEQTVAQFDAENEELATSFLTTFGITEQLEVGLDFNSLEGDVLVEGDVKYQFLDPGKHKWGLASGVSNFGEDEANPFFYVTTTRNIGGGTVSAGAGSDGDVTAFFGGSYPLTKKLTATGEFFTDEDGFALASLIYQITNHLSVTAWYQDFNESDVESLQAELTYQSHF